MDPFTALGLASNVIQFVDFVWNLLSETRRIAKSNDGLKGDHRMLEAIVADMQQYVVAISPSANSSPQLKTLAKDCSSIAAELLKALESLKSDGKKTHWDSFLMALKQVWKQSRIDELSTRLFKAQSQIAAHMQSIMVDEVSELNKAVRELCATNDNFKIKFQHDLNKLRKSIGSAIKVVKSDDSKIKRYHQTLEAIHTSTAQGITGQLHQLSQSLSKVQELEPGPASRCDVFLKAMDGYIQRLRLAQAVPTDLGSDILTCVQQFQTGVRDCSTLETSQKIQMQILTEIEERTSELKHREASLEQDAKRISQQLQKLSGSLISLEHGGQTISSYQAFCKQPKEEADVAQHHHHFVHWLRRENKPFWVQGKPGSGKSTLMKFIVGHPETRRQLEYWAEDKELVVASFYFWIAGTHLQKSQEGLLRSLLFQIFCKCPELVSPARQRLRLLHDIEGPDCSWSLDELLEMYKTILGGQIRKRFCFFIDGLDEFQSTSNDHRDLIKTLHDLDSSTDIKLCLSSRPWMIFEDDFGNNERWYFKLQDLTKDDIRQVVDDRLKAHFHLIKLQKSHDPGPEMKKYYEMMDQVVNRSQGVFVWVHLVLCSLLDGLTFGDSVRTLQARLDDLPEGLDSFYKHMLESIPKVYQPRAARMFRIALFSEKPLYLFFYSLLQDLEEDGSVILDNPINGMSSLEMEGRKHKMRRMLDGWSRGLLEVVSGCEEYDYLRPQVGFLHRTARDFLKTSEAPFLRPEGHFSEIDEHLLPCKAALAMLRVSPITLHHSDIESKMLPLFFHFFKRASEQTATLDALRGLSSRMDNTLVELSRVKREDGPGFDAMPGMFGEACRSQATFYLEWKLSQIRDPSALLGHGFYSALYCALDKDNPSAETIRLLLRYGANPNQLLPKLTRRNWPWTAWTWFMRSLFLTKDCDCSSRDKEEDFETARCLLLAGARLDHWVSLKSTTVMASDVIKEYSTAPQVAILLDCKPKRTRMIEKTL